MQPCSLSHPSYILWSLWHITTCVVVVSFIYIFPYWVIFILPHNCPLFIQRTQTIPMLKSNHTARISHIRFWLTSVPSILISVTVTQRGAATSGVIFGWMAPPAGWTHNAPLLVPSGHWMRQTVLILPDQYTYVHLTCRPLWFGPPVWRFYQSKI